MLLTTMPFLRVWSCCDPRAQLTGGACAFPIPRVPHLPGRVYRHILCRRAARHAADLHRDAAFRSFHVKSSSTSFMMVLTTVRVLPFFLTVTFMCSGTLMVSTFGARWYADQRYRSMQISATRHSSGVSTELIACVARPCTGS